jgi:hypothetical protein
MAPLTNSSLDPRTDKPPRCRQLIPISLRLFLAMLALLGIASVLWVGVPAYRQYVAVREIERLGGHVRRVPTGPTWIREWVGDENMRFFHEAVHVELGRTSATDATLSHVGRLTGLKSLWLAETKISDAGLVHLKGLSNLRVLDLSETQVTDTGLSHLEGLTNLGMLALYRTQVTDAGLAHLKGLSQLQGLYIGETKVTLAGRAALRRVIRAQIKDWPGD